MSSLNIKWNNIRPLDGSQQNGFEELCCQLAGAELPKDLKLERKGTPDAGVECYTVFPDKSEWAWQAKYFDKLGSSQWSQIDKSVEAALNGHPNLVKFYICIPLDLADSRKLGQQTAKDHWDRHVEKWEKWAVECQMNVEFIFWGSHELLDRLSAPEHVGRRHFFFGSRNFDQAWFQARYQEARQAAGPRYTPEIHINLPIAERFEAIGKTEVFFKALKSYGSVLKSTQSDAIGAAKRQFFVGTEVANDEENASEALITAQKQLKNLDDSLNDIIEALRAIEPSVTDDIAVDTLIQQIKRAREATLAFQDSTRDIEQELKTRVDSKNDRAPRPYQNPYDIIRHYLSQLQGKLFEAQRELTEARLFANAPLSLLTGEAGTGKTHLLCDIAQHRLAEGKPTILLMGQLFLSDNPPWQQTLQQLDLATQSADEFVGALEAAAQAAQCRALFIIDALNEGNGRKIWPNHLDAFLTRLENSNWIAVTLSIRSSYEEMLLSEAIRQRAVKLPHHGFADHVYDATRTFFRHYKLELPSTPLLIGEFRNPLFLKMLCTGLSDSGMTRLPRGFHGISGTFNLFIDTINKRLADKLDFNPKRNLVRKAVEALIMRFVELDQRWLPFTEAVNIVDALLPNKSYSDSIYYGMLSEGVLIEEGNWNTQESDEVVQIAYDRLADYLVANSLLDQYLDPSSPKDAFKPGEPLGFIAKADTYISPGLLEALCVQIPERIEVELADLAPDIVESYHYAHAFQQSLVWRDINAFSKSTHQQIRQVSESEDGFRTTLEAIVTIATLPSHPLNANWLHERLWNESMAERDAWWSTWLHSAWSEPGALARLVDWALAVEPSDSVEHDTVDLTSTVLAWTFSTSNRCLRDRATKALVSLLTGRFDALTQLLERFAGVSDLYIAERVFAVAYGCAMRSHDATHVRELAQIVYNQIFADGTPPAHVLLRDYARGVVEKALHLGVSLNIDKRKIRPPYHSPWPDIPSKAELEALKADWSNGAYDSRSLQWSRNIIYSSVMSGDFARYIIGTNSNITPWLSLRLNEPRWESPQQRFDTLLNNFSKTEATAWTNYLSAQESLQQETRSFTKRWCEEHPQWKDLDEEVANKQLVRDINANLTLIKLYKSFKKTERALTATLTDKHSVSLEVALADKDDPAQGHPPYFDLSIIQHYVLGRVFELGWTVERFGNFDRFNIHSYGREPTKAERIGKKYQWIAFYEISALIADNFQYHDEYGGSEIECEYLGSWQFRHRDIDPSSTLEKTVGGTSWGAHSPSWWSGPWRPEPIKPTELNTWLEESAYVPIPVDLLVVEHPETGAQWLNINGHFNWISPINEPSNDGGTFKGTTRYTLHGYLIASTDTGTYLDWAESTDLWGLPMPNKTDQTQLYMGEHPWAPASQYFQQPYYGNSGWIKPCGCPVPIRLACTSYLAESSTSDCSIEDTFSLNLPITELIRGLDIHWAGRAADYENLHQELIAFDPTAESAGPDAFLIRLDSFRKYLAKEDLAFCWYIFGEKMVLGNDQFDNSRTRISGAYILDGDTPSGLTNFSVIRFGSAGKNHITTPLQTVRSGPHATRHGQESGAWVSTIDEFQQLNEVGGSRAKNLADAGFKSIAQIAMASPNELENISGITPALAEKLQKNAITKWKRYDPPHQQ